jgi:predicted  nucleic acid-binding Zn-ribbon protein
MANTTVNIDIKVQSKSLNELENELSEINKELKKVPVNTQAFKDLSLQAQGLAKELDKAQQAAKGFTSEEKFRAADGAIKLLGGSLASVVGLGYGL